MGICWVVDDEPEELAAAAAAAAWEATDEVGAG